MAIIPCADIIVVNECSSDSIELRDFDHSHDHTNHTDDCTPFCTCICCGSIVIASTAQILDFPSNRFLTSIDFSYDFDYSLDYNKGIWHPPTTC